MATSNQQSRLFLYLYDLPRTQTTSVKLAEVFKQEGVTFTQKPQIHRDIIKPFYTAIIKFSTDADYKNAIEKCKYLKIDGKPIRCLPHDPNLRGENKQKILESNVFYKFPKDQDPTIFTYEYLDEKFSQYGDIKSIKIAINKDHSTKGYAFICFNFKQDAMKCYQALQSKGEMASQFQKKDEREGGVRVNNQFYFKNVAADTKDEDIKALFEPFGTIKSFITSSNDIGKFGFICYENLDASNLEKIKDLNGKVMGKFTGQNQKEKELKFYVKEHLEKSQREKEKFEEMIRYKNSKKRCNLHVKNFPENWTEKEIEDLFSQHGDIERVKLEKGANKNTYAFVCFKKPDQCSQAKHALHNQNFNGKGLFINQYEIKEIRDLQIEEVRDRRDWDKYIAQQGGNFHLMQLSNQPNLTHIIQQLLQLIQPNQMGDQRGQNNGQRRGMQGGPRKNFGQNRMNNNMRGPNQQMPQQMQQPNMTPQGMPQPMQQNNMQQQQPQPAQQQQQPLTPQQKFAQGSMQLLPAIQERNPYYKDQVGHLIYEFVEMLVGQAKAPKITGMLIELPIEQIKQYMQNFEALRQRVLEADGLLNTQGDKPAGAQ